ncbi:peptidase family M20/M25/M40 protein [Ophiocordyceps camponoti-floridani]|uniref:Peptidase family M20/M25/M40 protein n=1 Tax=Ophiocordyceps camponoti-floridani TaxID=2030778 RepID=A0A8H4Q697_9HYPO|nr:peptidase family M20/M25/M40 protein [Ophiocordyceps camponoti-floridani]
MADGPVRVPPPAVRRPHSDQPTKLGRRESRLGLKNIFARSKPSPVKILHPVPDTFHRSAGIRASLAELGHWPHAHHSDAALSPPSPPWNELSMTPDLPHPDSMARDQQPERRGGLNLKSPKRPRSPPTNCTALPLFKALSQAIRHVALPATTISADAIFRLNEKKHSVMDDAAAAIHSLGHGDREKERRKHRRNMSENLEWTTKIFVLVTSGYLLQYAGDGHFDRLPEKILRLGSSSAAFATDAIPGRHWVVQVSSTADADGCPAVEPRAVSFLSKLPFRIDRRSTSNMLMVFENANVMEAWISSLRTEIEKLGGKKNLSETGRPRTTESIHPPAQQWHGRHALAAEDASRLHQSRRTTVRRAREVRSSDGLAGVASPDAARHPSLDDDSASNSGVSQDEHQLDSLREHSLRYSLISSGQRTVLTSAGPSPEASPTREQTDEASGRHPAFHSTVVRPRPNGSDIAMRRQSSMQMASTLVDPDGTGSQSPSLFGPCLRSDGATTPGGLYPTPNFSVPQSSNRRYSHARIPPTEVELSSSPSGEPSPGQTRSKPPLAARTTHTLSVVMDQPPPLLEPPSRERPTTGHGGRRSPAKRTSRQRPRSTSRGRESSCASWMPEAGWGGDGTAPTLTSHEHDAGESSERQRRRRAARSMPPGNAPTISASSLDEASRSRRLTASPARIQAHASSPHLKVEMTEKALLNRRSMPQLGPPPAPPPTKALPPIPRNLQRRA